MDHRAPVYVAGHRGMVGSALMRGLASEACEVIVAGRDRVDLKRQSQVEDFLAEASPDAIVMAAAKVGGILANDTLPAAAQNIVVIQSDHGSAFMLLLPREVPAATLRAGAPTPLPMSYAASRS